MKKLSLLLVLIFPALCAMAQQNPQPAVVNSNDLRGRVEAAFEFEPIDDLSIEASVQMRLKSDLSSVDRFQTSLGVNYEVCKYFSLGADYVLINAHDPGSWDKPRHRANINLEGSIKAGRFEFSLRERVQTTFRTDSVNRFEKMNPEMVLRSRLSAEYNIRHSKWTPYLLFELHNTLNAPAVVANYKRDPYSIDNFITRYRAGVGVKFRATRNHRFDFYYYFDYDRSYNIDYKANAGSLKGYVQENECRHIFGITYKFKL
jgi:hypothetical protein